MRMYTGENSNQTYKSGNIVDLLEEIEQTKNDPQYHSLGFTPKPFVIGSKFIGFNKLYMPRTDVWTTKAGDRMCICVHVCPKFQNYPTVRWGIKHIGPSAKCICSGRCDGSHLVKNGEIIENSVIIENCLFDELRKPNKKQR